MTCNHSFRDLNELDSDCVACWKERAEKAEACAAEMRHFFEAYRRGDYTNAEYEHALSTDCGKDFVRRSDVPELIWVCEHCGMVEIAEVPDGTGISPVCQKCFGTQGSEYALVRFAKGWLSPEKAKELEERFEKQLRMSRELRAELGPIRVERDDLKEQMKLLVEALEVIDLWLAGASTSLHPRAVIRDALAAVKGEQK